MRIIITGASSFLGRAFIRRLTEKGACILPEAEDQREKESLLVQPKAADEKAAGRKGADPKTAGNADELVLFRHSFEEAPERLPETADAFVHFAWGGVGSAGRSDEAIQAQNVKLSMAALRMAEKLSCSRFLFAGSQAEYGGAQKESLEQLESGPCAPVSAYGKAKLQFGEWGARFAASPSDPNQTERKLRFIHMRIFSVYGPGDHKTSLIESCVRAFRKNEPMELGNCTQEWDYLYIDDAAAAIEGLLRSEKASGIYNIGSGDRRPLNAYIKEAREVVMSSSRLHFGVRGDHAEGAVSLAPSLARLWQETGFRPSVSFREGILRTSEAER